MAVQTSSYPITFPSASFIGRFLSSFIWVDIRSGPLQQAPSYCLPPTSSQSHPPPELPELPELLELELLELELPELELLELELLELELLELELLELELLELELPATQVPSTHISEG